MHAHAHYFYASANNRRRRHYVCGSSVRPSVVRPLTSISRDCTISLCVVEGFQCNLAQIFNTCVGIADKGFKVRGQRSDQLTYNGGGQIDEYQLRLGRQRQVWFIPLADTRGVQVKLWDPLRTRAIPERLRGVFTTRHYTNWRLPLHSAVWRVSK